MLWWCCIFLAAIIPSLILDFLCAIFNEILHVPIYILLQFSLTSFGFSWHLVLGG